MSTRCTKQVPGLLLLLLLLGPLGCARLDATRARFLEPQYVVTSHFYQESPQRVAVLPFASRSHKAADLRKAEGCRRVFYQHMCLRDFEDVELRRSDRCVFQPAETNQASRLSHLMDVVRKLDVVGMTTVLDLENLFDGETIDRTQFADLIRVVRDEMKADAYVLGITRDYGRLYAVVFSSVGLSTRMEMRSTRTGRLLWRGEWEKRSYEVPLTLNPLDIPRLMFDVWQHSRGLSMDSLVYRVYGLISRSIPYVPEHTELYVTARKPGAPYYRKPGVWFVFPTGRLGPSQRLTFKMEENGWLQCETPEGQTVWIFRRHARLVNQAGQAVVPYADLNW